MLSEAGLKLILDFEVGGGRPYYKKASLDKPNWPGGASGVTIGIGHDLGYVSLERWMDKISPGWVARLQKARGVKGDRARRLIYGLRDISIPWDTALDVFVNYTVEAEYANAKRAFPGMENLHRDVQGALVSLVFNRGTAMNGDKRKEMRQVRDAVARGDVQGIADAIRRMKRLWVGKGLNGLLRRRDAEAALVESTIQKEKG